MRAATANVHALVSATLATAAALATAAVSTSRVAPARRPDGRSSVGFSVSGSAAVIFVGVVVAAGVAIPPVLASFGELSGAQGQQIDRGVAITNTDFAIGQADYDGTADELSVNLTNDGSTTLRVEHLSVLVDGEIRTGSNLTTVVEGASGAELWLPGETLTVTVSAESADGRVKFVTGNGVAETTTGFGDST